MLFNSLLQTVLNNANKKMLSLNYFCRYGRAGCHRAQRYKQALGSI